MGKTAAGTIKLRLDLVADLHGLASAIEATQDGTQREVPTPDPAHRLPCIQGSFCGEPAHCPPSQRVEMPRMTDYLQTAKAELGFDWLPGMEPPNFERATAHALIDIAQSLRKLSDRPILVVAPNGDPKDVAEAIREAFLSGDPE